jgi:argininosuccinate lyase
LASLVLLHLSRYCEELIAWSSSELGLFVLPDQLVTSSSILPHKRNPDALELVRAKSARAISNLNRVQVLMKALPMGYSRDMQEDKEPLFDSCDTLKLCLDVALVSIQQARPCAERLRQLASDARYLSSDRVDQLVIEQRLAKPAAFAKVRGELNGASEPDAAHSSRRRDVDACVEARDVLGGTSSKQLQAAIAASAERLEALRKRLGT